jgi:uncharacterized membrane protein YfcA
MSSSSLAVWTLVLGVVAGVFSGMFGIGGGLVIVPALIFFFHVDLKTAVGTSLFALLWPVGLLGLRAYWQQNHLRINQGAWIAVGLFFGAYVGARITLALPNVTMKRVYAVFLIVVGFYLLYTTRGASDPRPKPAEDVPSTSVTSR